MKCKNTLLVLIMICTTLAGSWVIPSLVEKMTDESRFYPLMYYSSRLKELCTIDFRTQPDTFYDIKGHSYPRTAYDSLLPLLNAAQLMADGTMPDTIDGHAIDMQSLRKAQVMFRYRPIDMQMPQPAMGTLLESASGRVKLTLPGDYFTLDHAIEFVDAQTNTLLADKSAAFQNEMLKQGFVFPARAYWGNPSTRKSYDEGYFCLDRNNRLFHLKMAGGKPYVRDTQISDSLGIEWFVMNEAADHRHYGFLFGTKGELGLIEPTPKGGYRFHRLDIPAFDPKEQQLSILGNLLYWTVTVTDKNGMHAYALDRESLKCLSSYFLPRQQTAWDKVAAWMFPLRLSLLSDHNAYVGFYFHPGAWCGMLLNAVLALTVWVLMSGHSVRRRSSFAVWVFLSGLPGWLAWLMYGRKY